jgi:hypothetical protein
LTRAIKTGTASYVRDLESEKRWAVVTIHFTIILVPLYAHNGIGKHLKINDTKLFFWSQHSASTGSARRRLLPCEYVK